MDIIRINDLTLDCLIGVYEHERQQRRPLVINLELEADFSPGLQSDRIEDTLSYEDIYHAVCDLAEQSDFLLIEALAQAIADCCLKYERVHSVRVRIEKPGIFSRARSAGVEIQRRKNG